MSLQIYSSVIGLPNSKWSVTAKGSESSSKEDKTSKNGTLRTQALKSSGCMFMQAQATKVPPALAPFAAKRLG